MLEDEQVLCCTGTALNDNQTVSVLEARTTVVQCSTGVGNGLEDWRRPIVDYLPDPSTKVDRSI